MLQSSEFLQMENSLMKANIQAQTEIIISNFVHILTVFFFFLEKCHFLGDPKLLIVDYAC